MSKRKTKVSKGKAEDKTGRVVLPLGSEGDIEVESSPEEVICGRKDAERCIRGQMSQGEIKSTRRKVPSGRQGECNSAEKTGGLAVSGSLSPSYPDRREA